MRLSAILLIDKYLEIRLIQKLKWVHSCLCSLQFIILACSSSSLFTLIVFLYPANIFYSNNSWVFWFRLLQYWIEPKWISLTLRLVKCSRKIVLVQIYWKLKCKTYLLFFTKIHFNLTFVHFSPLTFKFIQLRLSHKLLLYVVVNFQFFKFFFKIFKLKKIQLMIEKYFPVFFFSKNFNKSWWKGFNWINMKLRVLKWTKTKLEDWYEF